MLFIHRLKWSCGFLLFIYWYGVLHSDVKPILFSWYKSHLVLVYNSFSMLLDTLRIMFNQISSHPMGQSSWHTKLTVLYTFSDFLLPSLLFTAWHHPCGQLDITGHRASSLQSGRPALYRLFDLDPLWENHWIAELQFPCLSMEIRASQGPLPGLGLWRV